MKKNETKKECYMRTLKMVGRILTIFDDALDSGKPDFSELSEERLDTTRRKLFNVLSMLQNAGYIEGVILQNWSTDGDDFSDAKEDLRIDPFDGRITLKGVEYLAEKGVLAHILNGATKAASSAGSAAGVLSLFGL